jgi:uncharacterized membrane protein
MATVVAIAYPERGGFATARGARWGGFWGPLFGALVSIPFAGWATGAALAALLGHREDEGIDETFERQVREHLRAWASALFLVRTSPSDADANALQDALQSAAELGVA